MVAASSCGKGEMRSYYLMGMKKLLKLVAQPSKNT